MKTLICFLALGWMATAAWGQSTASPSSAASTTPVATPIPAKTPVATPEAADEETASLQKEIEVTLGIDHIEYLNFTPSTARGAISIGGANLLKYELIPQKRQITFKGLKKGRTSVTMRDDTGEIKAIYIVDIKEHGQQKVIRDLQEFLKDVEGVEITTIGDTVVVQGEIVVPADIGRINMVLQKYSDVMNFVELSPQSKVLVAKRMQDEIQQSRIQGVTVRVVNGQFWLEGTVATAADKTKAENIAIAYLPDNIESLARRMDTVQKVQQTAIKNFIVVSSKPPPPEVPKLLKFTAQFVELAKDYSRVFGFSWQPLLSADSGTINIGKTYDGGVETSSSGTLTATISNLMPKLHSALSAGHARMLQSGSVITEVGKQAKISKVARRQFVLGSGEWTRPTEVKDGFDLTIGDTQGPQLIGDDTIEVSLGLYVYMTKSTDSSTPLEVSNNLSTRLILKSHETGVIGGLVTSSYGVDYDKNPPDGKTAPSNGSYLFSFIRSKNISEDKSQFVIFLTPEVVNSASEGVEKVKQKFRARRL